MSYSAISFADYFCKDNLNPWLVELFASVEAGNVCLDVPSVIEANDSTELPGQYILTNHELVGSPSEIKPFIYSNNKLYFQRYFHYEKSLADKISALCHEKNIALQSGKLLQLKDFVQYQLFPESDGLDETDWQQIACLNSFLHNFSIISGGPGTGKTTTITKLLLLFLKDNPESTIKLCAPTGKAAARMQESISRAAAAMKERGIDGQLLDTLGNLQSTTIHSLLGYVHNSIYFKHDADNYIQADVILVDECSMIDITLFYKLFQAIDPEKTVVILLGDKNQLASVNAGSIFRDICEDTAGMNAFSKERIQFLNQFIPMEKNQIPIQNHIKEENHPLFQHLIELKKSFRFSDNDGIGILSKAVLQNDVSVLDEFFNNRYENVKIYHFNEYKDRIDHAVNLLFSDNGGYVGLHDVNDILLKLNNSTVLCATNEGKYGVTAINKHFLQKYNIGDNIFGNYQLIMVTQNQPEQDIYNGDIGVVLENNNKPEVYFDKGNKGFLKLSPAQINSFTPSFAMTIHKSQGSEYNEVLILLPDNKDNLLLTRELLYTAITRAKKKVSILGSKDIITTICNQTVRRVSGLASHFKTSS
ncbi:MAG: exodeoxyribonuclease V subunit alpha [Saprospiraceae bacterium]|nr:exodeoxyribonuclease V subunit alpha [Saprospiraceae bacterium]